MSDFLYRRWKCHFLDPQNGHFCQKCPSWDLKKRHFQCRYKKSETTFIIQTFPKNEDYSLWFHLLSLFRVGLDDFHFRALSALISEGKSDQNEKCNFAKEGVLKSKKWRQQTHLKTQFYIRKSVWQSILGTLSDLAVMSISPNIYWLCLVLKTQTLPLNHNQENRVGLESLFSNLVVFKVLNFYFVVVDRHCFMITIWIWTESK